MAQNLPNTGVEVWNDTTDAQMSYRQWYNTLSGLTNSNMVKIDNAVGSKADYSKTMTAKNGASGNANDYMENGLWKVTLTSNMPSGLPDGNGILEVVVYAFGSATNAWLCQTFKSAHNMRDSVYVRSIADNVWSRWVKSTNNTYSPITVSNVLDLPVGKWFGVFTGAPIEGVCYYDVIQGDNASYKHMSCISWLENSRYENQCSNGNWLGWDKLATYPKPPVQLTPLNGWEKTGNNICRVTDLGNGTSKLEFELRASTTIPASTQIVSLPQGLQTIHSLEPMIVSLATKAVNGYVYKDGRVVLAYGANANEVITLSVVITNK